MYGKIKYLASRAESRVHAVSELTKCSITERFKCPKIDESLN